MKRENNRDRKRGYCESLFSLDSLNFLKLKNFPKTKVQNSCRENAKRYYCAHSFFSFGQYLTIQRNEYIRGRGEGGKEKREKTGDMEGWLKSVCTGLQRVSRRYRTTAEI